MSKNIHYERLKILWESMGIKDANEFAKSIGWERAENILRLNRKGNETKAPGILILEDIAKVYSDFDFGFLFTGEKEKTVKQDVAKEPGVKFYTCPDCIDKQKEVDKIDAELKEMTRKYILALEELQDKRGCG